MENNTLFSIEIKPRKITSAIDPEPEPGPMPAYNELIRVNDAPYFHLSKALEFANQINFTAWDVFIVIHEGPGIGQMEVVNILRLIRMVGLVTIDDYILLDKRRINEVSELGNSYHRPISQ